MTDTNRSTEEVEEVTIDLHTNDKPEDFSSGGDPVTRTRDNVETVGVEVESPAVSVSVTPKGPGAGEQELPELRYANPHGTFITGIDINSEEAALKRLQRAERFGLSEGEGERCANDEDPVGKREARAKRFGTKLVAYKGEPVKLVDELPDIPGGDLRPKVVHLHGTNEMSTSDVFSYFQSYAPRNIEWINDSSCNVVWEDAESASRALHGLTIQPVALRSTFIDESEPMDTASLTVTDEKDTETKAVVETEDVLETQASDGGEVQWRVGVDFPKAKQLLLRYAVAGDQKVVGASKLSSYYLKYGNPNKMATRRLRNKSEGQDLGISDPADNVAQKNTWRDQEVAQDLRHRLNKRERGAEEDGLLEIEDSEGPLDPLASLVKRPKPLHSERLIEEVEERVFIDDSERERMTEGADISKADLRNRIRKKRKRKELKLRVGHNPRLVERTL